MLFITVGGACAAIDLGIMQLLISNAVAPWIAASIAFAVCVIVNYTAHARLTFDAPSSLPSFLRFLAIVGLNYVITVACVQAAHSLLGNAIIGKLASYPIVTLNGFLLGKYWVFKTN